MANDLVPGEEPTTRGVSRGLKIGGDVPPSLPEREHSKAAALGFLHERERGQEVSKIKVSIKHGDLRYARSPVLLGHYQADSIVGAERFLDQCLDGKLSERRRLGLYPGPIETTDVVLDDEATPPGAIVVGLGAVGSLSTGELRRTIAKGLVNYALLESERDSAATFKPLKVTSMLVGSGEGGVTIQNSVAAILEGALEASRALLGTNIRRRVRIDEVELLEIHLDRAVNASRVLRTWVQEGDHASQFEIANWRVTNGKGGWRRVAYEQDKDWWTRLQISEGEDGLQFISLSDRARAEARMLPLQRASLDAFLRDAVQTTRADRELSQTLFELLLPNQIKDATPQDRNLVLIVDEKSARFPWELLQDGMRPSVEPLAVRSGMVRQMQSWTFREKVVNTTQLRGFVVGDPPAKGFAELNGAKNEAVAVVQQLRNGGFEVQPAIREGFREILQKLFAHPYRVLHLAGHGVVEFPAKDEAVSSDEPAIQNAHQPPNSQTVTGMVLGDNAFLTPAIVDQMRTIPELVFINCCYLGAEAGQQRYYHLAANLGTQLIEMGVRAVVAAGWAVDDGAAKTFAEEFYRQMLDGKPFGEAVQKARHQSWLEHRDVNTWGAYQCYGDPGYVLLPKSHRHGGRSEPNVFSVVDEAIFAIENIGAQATTAVGSRLKELRHNLVDLIQGLPSDWTGEARLLEVLGHAYGEVGLYEKAVESYNKARRLEQATFSVKAIEQSANLRCRWAVHVCRRSRQLTSAQDKDALHDATAEVDKAINETINDAIKDIELVLQIGETKERFSLQGAAYKRQALVTTSVARDGALKSMKQAYKKAHHFALKRDGKADFYPTLNWLTARVLRHLRGNDNNLNDVGQWLDRVEADILNSEGENLSFWSAIAQVDAQLVRHLVSGNLDQESVSTLLQGYLKERPRASAREFGSVLEHLDFLVEVSGEQVPGTRRQKIRSELCVAVKDLYQQLLAVVGDEGLLVD